MLAQEIIEAYFGQDRSINAYMNIAQKICPKLPEKIHQTYTSLSANPSGYEYLYKFVEDTSQPLSLELLTTYGLMAALSGDDISSSIDSYKKTRRDTKRNWSRTILKEAEDLSNQNTTLYKTASTIAMASELDPTVETVRSIDEIIQSILNSIEAWRSNTSMLLSSYPLLKTKPNYSACKALYFDIILESLLLLKEKPTDFMMDDNIKVPRQLNQYPLISLTQTPLGVVDDLIKSELMLSNQYSNFMENEHARVDVSMNIPAKYIKENTEIKELDTRDQDIITRIFSRLTPDILDNKQITIGMTQFAKEIYDTPEPKKRNYDDLLERLEKLANYTYDIKVTDTETGEVLEQTFLSLVSYLHLNRKDKVFVVSPSDQLLSSYIQKNFVMISSDAYNKIGNNKTRVYMMILQEQRMLEFAKGSSVKSYPLSFFRARLKTIKMTNTVLRKELSVHLQSLVDNGCVIKSFSFSNKKSTINVEFLPLTEDELSAYGLNETTDDIIAVDSEYKEL